MNIINHIKKTVESAPFWFSRHLVHVPYVFRLGANYPKFIHAASMAERSELIQIDHLVLAKLRRMLIETIDRVDFYRDFYRFRNFSAQNLHSWEDWQQVPIVTKADLQSAPIASRIAHGAKGMKINTGGTSGQPLEFYLDRNAFAREWAHMHYIWKAHGYKPQHLKLTFRGKHFDSKQPLRYNAVHNEFIVNANTPMQQVVNAVASLPRKTVIRWLHGYPSLIAEFAYACTKPPNDMLSAFRSRLFGVLLGSEYPTPSYRTAIENILSTNTVSWYGHSEMAVLARETAVGIYESLPTYGYAEAVPSDYEGKYRLICTSFYNNVHPFIRYDTGDLIDPLSSHGGSLSFRITDGRVGDFVHDRHGNRHSLTAVIFGRHHAAFEMLKHVQVREDAPGRVTLMVTPRDAGLNIQSLRQGFDLDDLDINWCLELVDEPIRTQAGKIRLKIS